jgi:spore coat polysaccharide biosynthesis protein SpsF (cytidylyltransferase family)
LENVADRFARIIEKTCDSGIIRICGDSPLIDPELITASIDHFNDGNYDLVTNIFPRTFPKGQSVEIINPDVFTKAFKEKYFSKTDLEHVTSHFYLNERSYSIYNLANKINNKDFSKIQLSVDTLEDFEMAENIISTFNGLTPDWLSIVKSFDSI